MEKVELKILLGDDFEMVRMMLRGGLNSMGHEKIDEAVDGREALAMIKAAYSEGLPYDLVFCDWMMPEVNGIEVVEACRALSEFKSLPIIMVTAEAEQRAVIRAIKAGANDYIIKPFTAEILAEKIARVIAKLS